MIFSYDHLLNFMLQELRPIVPATVVKFEALQTVYGTTLVFYGTYIVLGIQLDIDRYGVEGLTSLTRKDVFRDIPVETLNTEMRAIIEDMVRCFCTEYHVDGNRILAE